MNEQELQELKKELAEWRGFTWEQVRVQGLPDVLIHIPDGKDYIGELPDFPNDLTAIFKWLVPKYIDEIKAGVSANYIGNAYARLFERWQRQLFFGNWEEPALALCLVIKELNDKRKEE